MKTLLLEVKDISAHLVVKAYSLEKLSATLLDLNGKTYLAWPYSWFADKKTAKTFYKSLLGFVQVGGKSTLRLALSELDWDCKRRRSKNFRNLLNFIERK